jgi:hypothetical protein
MLGKVTTLSTLGTTAYQPTDSQVQLKASTDYIINTDCIVEMKVLGSTDSDLLYKLSPEEDRTPAFRLRVDDSNSDIDTIADTSPASNLLSLNVYLNEEGENALTFAECAGYSTTAKYYNISDIRWVEENADQNLSFLWVSHGGQSLEKIFVDHGLDMLIDKITTGTTTTTTSSTSTTTA